MTWIPFMRQVGERFHRAVAAKVSSKLTSFAKRENFTDENGKPEENVDELTKRVKELGILGFGEFRGSILLDTKAFPKLEASHLSSIAGLLLAVGFVERTADAVAMLRKDGHVEFTDGNNRSVTACLVDGSTDNLSWLSLETQMRSHEDSVRHKSGNKSRRVIAIGVTGMRPEDATPPKSIVRDVDTESILEADEGFSFWDVLDFRTDTSNVTRLLS